MEVNVEKTKDGRILKYSNGVKINLDWLYQNPTPLTKEDFEDDDCVNMTDEEFEYWFGKKRN